MLRTVPARVNWGSWIVDCLTPGCNGAEPALEVPRGAPDGTPGRPVEAVCCASCKTIHLVAWPADREAIEAALAARPLPANRNWWPPGHPLAPPGLEGGETVADLLAENDTNLREDRS